ncbi:uncharacterized protein LOC131855111 isoform X1 [Achroia grisella]|uniref:uncharacterized protein LOC131855111 isoform X1 n=1 Tax=Achroia grisella TaxID=688607 RepID=UPI0027D20D15|nr:uncharacterized protein LOC131855111 isoform X1 [Achroia grisella]
MDKKNCFLIFVAIQMAKGSIPGTFFWKPRLGLDLAIPTTEVSMGVHKPNKNNIRDGFVVLIDGYQVGVTIIAVAASVSSASTNPHLNPLSAYFYTNIYRWGLRYFSLLPFWLSGNGGNYCDTHKVWRRRFYYMDEFVPELLRKFVPFIKNEEWEKEQLEFKKFKKYAEPAFGKHYRYPTKVFRNFKSQETVETVENLDDSSNSM